MSISLLNCIVYLEYVLQRWKVYHSKLPNDRQDDSNGEDFVAEEAHLVN